MFALKVFTPDKELYAGPATFLAAKAVDGEIGILANHAPLIALLAPGPLRYHLPDGKEVSIKGSDGFLKVEDNKVFVLLA